MYEQMFNILQTCTHLYTTAYMCTQLYTNAQLYTTLHNFTPKQLYTTLYNKTLQNLAKLYKHFTQFYKTLQESTLYKTLQYFTTTLPKKNNLQTL